jgi:hypothetical protein
MISDILEAVIEHEYEVPFIGPNRHSSSVVICKLIGA